MDKSPYFCANRKHHVQSTDSNCLGTVLPHCTIPGDNVVIGSKVIAEDSRNNIIKLPDDHLGIINGLDGYIVAEKGNVLLICKKEDSSALIRKYINEVQVKFGEEYI